VFESFNGLPLHPLLVHAVVVLVPLLVIGALAYVLFPRLRGRLAWVVVLLALAAPVAALAAELSGTAFRARLIKRNLTSPSILTKISQHESYGQKLVYVTIALGVLTLLVAYLTTRRGVRVPAWGSIVLNVAVVAVALACAFYVFQTGDTGAKTVWTGY
jgi:uncharacterized membrane protein